MTITKTVKIPADRRLTIDVPREIPTESVILTFTPAGADNERSRTAELRGKLHKLRGSLGSNAFGGLDGVAYQKKVRSEWD